VKRIPSPPDAGASARIVGIHDPYEETSMQPDLEEALLMLVEQAEAREAAAKREGRPIPTLGLPNGHPHEALSRTEYARAALETQK
jgi:hypothetical protein